MINPYYDPEKLELELISFDEWNVCYDFNTLCFWSTKAGLIFAASDSGCSCPTPFEDYEGESQKEVIQKLTRIPSVESGLSTFDSWNNDIYAEENRCSLSDKNRLETWLQTHLK